MSNAGCSNKSVELPNMGQTVPFVKGKDSEGEPAGGPGGAGGGSKTGLKKWTGGGGTAPAKTPAAPAPK